uniref:NADH-ubiquinone oxidoreductase chain 3 n=1 Tax=Centrorhynchus clitorideus TaxID=2731796 RepID=A0A6M3Z149_9BILA|nr:NADH dehydrogenase subunit 3 [Centrorhynchus clitorideus]
MGVILVLGVGLVVVLITALAAIALSLREGDGVSAEMSYESGFMIMVSEMQPLSVRFFVLGVVFLLLDLETAVVLSTPPSLNSVFEAEGVMVVAVIWVYMIGTVYEWWVGSLEWFM